MLLVIAGCARGPAGRQAANPPSTAAPAGQPGVTPPPARRYYEALRDSLAGAPAEALRGRVIVLDPGHGGRYDGVIGPGGLREADVNLGVALALDSLLASAGAHVHLTRDADHEVARSPGATLRDDLLARRAMADSLHPDLFLSIHHNSSLPLDRARDTSDIFFRLNDEGPSLDAARCIHRALVRNLGLPPGSITAANYLVLRGSGPPAVLSEASYLSNPAIESLLTSPGAIRLEAAAYYLGLAAWFAAGIPSVREDSAVIAGGAETGPEPVFRLLIDAAGGLDPASFRARVDDDSALVDLDPDGGRAWVRPAHPVAAGAHRLEVEMRNMAGNAAPAYARDFTVFSPPARIVLSAAPGSLPASGASFARVRARVVDRFGNPVADGTPLHFTTRGGRALDGDPALTRAGWADIHVLAAPGRGAVRLRAWVPAADTAMVSIPRRTAGPPLVWGQVTADDGGTGSPAAATVRVDDAAPVDTDPGGWFAVELTGTTPAGPASTASRNARLVATSPGFEPESADFGIPDSAGAVRQDIRLRESRYPALRALHVVLDPAGGGDDTGSVSADGDLAKTAALRLADRLAWLLTRAGARVTLTRDRDASESAVDRIRVAEGAAADLVIRIDARPGAPGAFATVSHYPGSAAGSVLADSIGARLGLLGLGRVESAETAVFTVQQVSAPAIDIALTMRSETSGPAAFPDSTALTGAAGAILDGIDAARPARAGLPAAGAPAAGSTAPEKGVDRGGSR